MSNIKHFDIKTNICISHGENLIPFTIDENMIISCRSCLSDSDAYIYNDVKELHIIISFAQFEQKCIEQDIKIENIGELFIYFIKEQPNMDKFFRDIKLELTQGEHKT